MSVESLTTFLGWCLVFNISAILIFLVKVTVFKDGIARLSAKLFGVSEQTSKDTMFRLFVQFRFQVFFFNVVPWAVLYFVW